MSRSFLQEECVVAAGLHTHQERVERRCVDPRCVESRLERLDERRTGAGERVEDVTAGSNVALQEPFHELRDELPEVRVQTMHVLRPLSLRKLRLRPGKPEILVRESPRRAQLACEQHLRVRRHPGWASYSSGTRSTRPPDTPTASIRSSSDAFSGCVASQARAAVFTRRTNDPTPGGYPPPRAGY